MAPKKGYDFVLDCSFTMAWLFEDEGNQATDDILHQMKERIAVVPTIWPLEVANVLLMAQKHKRISAATASGFVDALAALPIIVDETTSTRAMHSIYTIAESNRLAIYDAAYLELAVREKIPLLSLDQDMVKAAKKMNVSTRL